MEGNGVILCHVGNTRLFPNGAKRVERIARDRLPAPEHWQALERKTKVEFDQAMQNGGTDHGFWWMFHTSLLEQLNEKMAMRDTLIAKTHDSANWDQIPPGTRDALDHLRKTIRIAVISNAYASSKPFLTPRV